jgi:TolB-like protein/Tfp pilus assembly protein PilF
LGGFIAELKRRHVVRAGVAYAAVGFVVLQAAEIIQQAWAFPEWVLRLVVVFTLLGFPLVVALAWVYEITPMGLRTTRDLDGGAALPEMGGLPRIAFLILTTLAVGVSGWWWVRSNVGDVVGAGTPGASGYPAAAARGAGEGIRSLAVLPFESFSPEQGRDYFAEGMHEALISRLSQLDFLRVLSRTSASHYDKTGKSVPQIGAELGVDALIEGSVLRADGRVRITVQLIEVATDRHLWARDYERDLVDVIALQREVADAVVAELRGELAPDPAVEAQVTASAPAPVDPEATEAVMMGRMALADAAEDAQIEAVSLDSAAQHFQRAIQRDPTFAPAHSGLAQVYLMRALSGEGEPSPEDVRAAEESVKQALALDPNSRETQEVVAHFGLLSPEQVSELVAGGPFAPEVRLGSDSIGIVIVGSEERPMLSLTEPGRQLEIAWARRDAESGSSDALVRAARRFFSIGMPDQARDVLQRVVVADPRHMPAWDELEQIHRAMGDLDAVVELWRNRSRVSPAAPPTPGASPSPSTSSIRALEQAVARDSAAGYWTWRLGELEARSQRGAPVSPVELAVAHAGLGDADEALTLLEEAARAGDPRVRFVRSDPVWDPLRRDPRFMRVMAQMERFGPSAPAGRGSRGPGSQGDRDGGRRDGEARSGGGGGGGG